MSKNKLRVLITGGAGYIGSHLNLLLNRGGHEVVVFDNLASGHRDAALGAKLIIGDLADYSALAACFAANKFDAVIHLAGLIQNNESIFYPEKYYQNNVTCGLNLLNAMMNYGVKILVYSSSAAVYGNPQSVPIAIDHPKNPLTPYGKTKLIFEEILRDYYLAYGLRSISLRFFNAAGADPSGLVGERHNPETHLIPLVLQAASGGRKHLEVFGNDYATEDGTCVRDYIHVIDLCRAHQLALDALLKGMTYKVYNLGSGSGYSVLDIVTISQQITGQRINAIFSPRRAGDPAVLIADIKLANKELNWYPECSDLATIIKHAWQYEKNKGG